MRQLVPAFRSLTIALLCGAALVFAGPARGQDEGDARELRRILHLRSGQTLRAVTRCTGERWEYRAEAGWREVPKEFVASSELESEVLRAWKEKKAASTADVDLRVQGADWALSAGLVTEGVAEMTAILATEPDCAAALGSLREHADVLRVPSIEVPAEKLSEAKQALLRFGAALPPGAAREFAVLELGKLPRDETLREDLLTELRSRVVTRRSFGALALRRLLPGEAIEPIMLHAVLDPSEEVRVASSLALRAAGEPGLIVPIVRVIEKSPSSELRMRAAEALGTMGYKAAVQPLVARLSSAQSDAGTPGRIPHANIFVGRQFAYIQDFDVEVAQFQAVADPKVNVLIEGSALDAAVVGVQDIGVSVEVAAVRSSLERLTGDSPGKTTKAWLAWWEKNGSKWRSEELSRPRTQGGEPVGG